MSTETINVLFPAAGEEIIPRDFIGRYNRAVWYTNTHVRVDYQAQPHEVLREGTGLSKWNKAYDGDRQRGVRLIQIGEVNYLVSIFTDYPNGDEINASNRFGTTHLDVFEKGAPLDFSTSFFQMAGKRLERADLPRQRNDQTPIDANIMPFIVDGSAPILTPARILRIMESFWPAINAATYASYGTAKGN